MVWFKLLFPLIKGSLTAWNDHQVDIPEGNAFYRPRSHAEILPWKPMAYISFSSDLSVPTQFGDCRSRIDRADDKLTMHTEGRIQIIIKSLLDKYIEYSPAKVCIKMPPIGNAWHHSSWTTWTSSPWVNPFLHVQVKWHHSVTNMSYTYLWIFKNSLLYKKYKIHDSNTGDSKLYDTFIMSFSARDLTDMKAIHSQLSTFDVQSC